MTYRTSYIYELSLIPEVFKAHSPMPRIMLNRIGFAFPVWIYQLGHDKTIIAHAVGLCDSKWITLNCLNGSPNVDDLNAML